MNEDDKLRETLKEVMQFTDEELDILVRIYKNYKNKPSYDFTYGFSYGRKSDNDTYDNKQ